MSIINNEASLATVRLPKLLQRFDVVLGWDEQFQQRLRDRNKMKGLRQNEVGDQSTMLMKALQAMFSILLALWGYFGRSHCQDIVAASSSLFLGTLMSSFFLNFLLFDILPISLLWSSSQLVLGLFARIFGSRCKSVYIPVQEAFKRASQSFIQIQVSVIYLEYTFHSTENPTLTIACPSCQNLGRLFDIVVYWVIFCACPPAQIFEALTLSVVVFKFSLLLPNEHSV